MAHLVRKFSKFMIYLAAIGLLISACSEVNSNAESETVMPCPTYKVIGANPIPQAEADLLIGMTESQAQQCAENLGWTFFVGERDGEMYPLTRDYRVDRVVAGVKEDLVFSVAVG